MNDLNRMDLEYLLFLAKKGYFTRIKEFLGNPFALEGELSTQNTPHEPMAALNALRGLGGNAFRHFLDLHLITHSLLFKNDRSECLMTWLDREVDLDLHLPGMTREQVLGADWKAAPVLVVHEKARVIYFVTGLLSATHKRGLWPPWADGLMDNECKSAIETAASAAESAFPLTEDKSLFCFPLLAPGESIQVKGPSLGLSLALGFLSLIRNDPLPRYLVASGSLAGTGGSVGEAEAINYPAASGRGIQGNYFLVRRKRRGTNPVAIRKKSPVRRKEKLQGLSLPIMRRYPSETFAPSGTPSGCRTRRGMDVCAALHTG